VLWAGEDADPGGEDGEGAAEVPSKWYGAEVKAYCEDKGLFVVQVTAPCRPWC
jgi:hypothetical protein